MSTVDRSHVTQRLARLESEAAQLRALLNEPSEQPTAQIDGPGRPVEYTQPSITYQLENSGFPMPSEAELRKLYEIVLRHYPWLRPQPDRRSWEDDDPDGFQSFRGAFMHVGNMRRTTEPNKKYGLGWFVDDCQIFLRARNLELYKHSAWKIAVIAWGDVGFVPANQSAGVLWGFCLDPYIGRKAAEEGWRKVLASGRVLEPLQPRALREVRSPVQLLVNAQSYFGRG